MALLDEVKKTTDVAAKKSNYQKKARAKAREAAEKVAKFIKGTKVEVPVDVQEALDLLTRKPKAGTFGKPVIYRLFGNAPKVGDKVTALKVFETTQKGFAEMRGLIKKWSEKGIEVKFDDASKTYSIVKGTIAPYAE